MTDSLTCQELVELVTLYLEDALDADERARFEAHLADCTGCTRYVQQLRLTVRALGRLREDDVPEGVLDELLQLFRDWKKGQVAPPAA